ncbi:MAG: hypothetical protein C4531_13305 [Desulfurivibrio sp.]|jgi:hypothetical protein|nr:MAG: hypothetical protein C4531_13305 [Desulfurivibrio sp.]
MKIDITREPPTDVYRNRGKYILIAIVLLSLAVCGILLMVYGFVSDTPPSDTLEKAALTLLLGPALIFVYFGGKLRAYIRMNQAEKKELDELCRKHAEIAAYCGQVARQGREPILAEYHACQEWAENENDRRREAEKG